MSLIHQTEPKIIWLRIGNSSTTEIYNLFVEKYPQIKNFIEDNLDYQGNCLELF